MAIWCEAWEAGAKQAEIEGAYLFAACLRGMAKETREINRAYHVANDLRQPPLPADDSTTTKDAV